MLAGSSGSLPRFEREDEGEESSSAGCPTSGDPDHIDRPHVLSEMEEILGESNETSDSDDEEHKREGEIGFEALHGRSLSS